MRLGLSAALLVVCTLSAASAQDEQFTGTKLYMLCTADAGSQDDTVCDTWMLAYSDGLTDTQSIAKNEHKSPVTCIPVGQGGTSPLQFRLVVVKFMRDNPQILNHPAHLVAYSAIKRAFPCKNTK